MTPQEQADYMSFLKERAAQNTRDVLALQDATADETYPSRKPSLLAEVHQIETWDLIHANKMDGKTQNPAAFVDVIDELLALGGIEQPATLAEIRRDPFIVEARPKAYRLEKVVKDRVKFQLMYFGGLLWRAKMDRRNSNLHNPEQSRANAARVVEQVQAMPFGDLNDMAAELPSLAARFVYAYAAYVEIIEKKGLAKWPPTRPFYKYGTLFRTDVGIPGYADPQIAVLDKELDNPQNEADADEIREIVKRFID